MEFNDKVKENRLPKTKINSLMKLLINPENLIEPEIREEDVKILLMLLKNWPNDFVFPVLDLTRLMVLKKNFNTLFCQYDVLNILTRHVQNDSNSANQLLTFRLLANLFNHETGREFCLATKNNFLQAIDQFLIIKNKHIEVIFYFIF